MSLKHPHIILFRAALVIMLLLIGYLTTVQIDPQLGAGINDKLSHLLAFFALALLTDFAFPTTGLNARKVVPLFIYGVIIEIVQYYLPYREFSLLDMLANGAGILVYWVSIPLMRRAPRLKARWVE